MIKDQIDAAIMTPEANPNNSFSSRLCIWCLKKKTMAEPSRVPKNGKNKPIAIVSIQPIYHILFENACLKLSIVLAFCLKNSCGIIYIDERNELV